MNAFLDKWRKLTEVKKELIMKNWFSMDGNVSIKISEDPLLFLVSAKQNRTGDEEFIVVNEQGEKVFKESEVPSSEVLIHSFLYQQTVAECILHARTINNHVISEIYGDVGEIILPNKGKLALYHSLHKKGDNVFRLPIIQKNKEALTNVELYKEHVFSDVGAILVKNHGITVWGRTIEETKAWLEEIEFLIASHIKLLMVQNQSKSFI